MGKVLIFGGLTTLGQPIINQLLNDGDEVISVRSEGSSTEEDIEMLFGRNAFFQAAETDWIDKLEKIESVICLDSTAFTSPEDAYADAGVIAERISKCLEACRDLKDIIIASHIDIYGQVDGVVDERTPVSPVTDKGCHVDQVEKAVIETLIRNKDKARTVRAIICRLPDMNNGDRLVPGESISLEDAAKGICALLHTNQVPGIEVIQLTSGQEYSTPQGKVRYTFDKAKSLIDFSPKEKS